MDLLINFNFGTKKNNSILFVILKSGHKHGKIENPSIIVVATNCDQDILSPLEKKLQSFKGIIRNL